MESASATRTISRLKSGPLLITEPDLAISDNDVYNWSSI
jgi:hypothetical protein